MSVAASRDETIRGLFIVFEILNLTQALGCFFARLVGAAEIFALLGQDLVACFYFLDHGHSLLGSLSASLLRHQYGLRCMQARVICVFLEGKIGAALN
jgi:hypothetical protein